MAADHRGVLRSMPFITRFPGYCAECETYVAAGAGVYIPAAVRVYCAAHAPDDLFNRLAGPSERRTFADLHRKRGRTRARDPFPR